MTAVCEYFNCIIILYILYMLPSQYEKKIERLKNKINVMQLEIERLEGQVNRLIKNIYLLLNR